MKVCKTCGNEIATRDGNNECSSCEEASQSKRRKAKRRRQERNEMMSDLGLVKVHGALGGTYWE